jgi:hypothetical protein
MPTPELIRAFLSQAKASGGRSTALQPLGWLTATLALGLVLAAASNAPVWSTVLFGISLGGSVLLYLSAYVYFALKNPDALRSEKFTLSKMALEKNLIGDNRFGLLEIEETEKVNKAAALPNRREGEL